MDYFLQEANRIREEIQKTIAYWNLDFKDVVIAGAEAVSDSGDYLPTHANGAFADQFGGQHPNVPIEVFRAICLSAVFLEVACVLHEEQNPSALVHLLNASQELGHIRGVASGVVHVYENLREKRSTGGALGAQIRHKRTTELKAWALEKAKDMRGADMDIARRLELQVPSHLADASKDHRRLIYETLRKRRTAA